MNDVSYVETTTAQRKSNSVLKNAKPLDCDGGNDRKILTRWLRRDATAAIRLYVGW